MLADRFPENDESKSRGGPQGMPLEGGMVLFYMYLLGHSRKSLVSELARFREIRHGKKCGPEQASFNRMIREGWAVEDMWADLLQFLRKSLAESYEKGFLTPSAAPMIERLDEWHKELWNLVGPEGWPGSQMMDRKDCFSEIWRMIRTSKQNRVLYVSAGRSFCTRTLIESLGLKWKPSIERIVVRPLPGALAGKLLRLGLLKDDFYAALDENIRWLTKAKNVAGIPVEVHEWKSMPRVHGLMYGEEVLYYGRWTYGDQGLDVRDGPMYRLTAKGGSRFEEYRDLFMNGDGGSRRR